MKERTKTIDLVEIEPADWVADLDKLPGGIRLRAKEFGLVNIFIQQERLVVVVSLDAGKQFATERIPTNTNNQKWLIAEGGK